MLRNYLLTALRQCKKNRLHTSVQLAGLAVSITASLLLLVYVHDEWAFDRYHRQADRLFRLTTRVATGDTDDHLAFSLFVVAPRVKERYPEVAGFARIMPSLHKQAVRYGARQFNEPHVLAADAAVLSLFTYPLRRGNPATALAGPGSVVVSDAFARRYFGAEDPMGKTLFVSGAPYRVTGLMEDVPAHSDLYVEALLSLDDPDAGLDEWCYTFLLLEPGAGAAALEKKLAGFAREPLFDSYDADASNLRATYYLEPLPGVHFLAGRQYDQPKGNKAYLYVCAVLAVLLLAVAGVNSVNLSVAQALGRGREAAVRKALGATAGQVGGQAAGEVFLLLAGALLLAGLLTVLVLPSFNQLAGKRFSPGMVLTSPALGGLLAGVALLGGLTGGYLARRVNRPGLAGVLKGGVPGPRGGRAGSVLVVVQFAGAVTLMSGALVVHRQMQWLHDRDLGFRPGQVLVLAAPGGEAAAPRVRAFAERLLRSPRVAGVSLCDIGGEPGSFVNKDLFLVEQEGQLREKVVANLDCDARYLPLLGIRLRQGRNFDEDRTADAQGAYLVNEAFVRWMGWRAPLGKKIELFGRPGEVIGVVDNFHFASLHQRVEPLILTYGGRIPEKILLKTGAASPAGTLALARHAWGQLFPDHPFEYRRLDESLARQYAGETRMRRVFDWGAALTVGTACLGLFAMASLAGQRRKKEIGIRKVLGATRESIVFLLLRAFLARVLLGVGPALPLAWYLGNRWLESFVYRMPPPMVPLALAALITLALAVLTTLYHGLRASRINPAITLQAPA